MKIEINDVDFARLQQLAVPLKDTTADVVARLIDFYEISQGRSQVASASLERDSKRPWEQLDTLPPVTFSKLLAASMAGQRISNPKWDALLKAAITHTVSLERSVQEAQRICGCNMVDGRKDDEGYKYVPQLRLSYQGVSAEDAVRIVQRVCRYYDVACEFEFEWRKTSKAFMPGRRAAVRLSQRNVEIAYLT